MLAVLEFGWEEGLSQLYVKVTEETDHEEIETRLARAWETILRRWRQRNEWTGKVHVAYSVLASAGPHALAASLSEEEWRELGLEPVLPDMSVGANIAPWNWPDGNGPKPFTETLPGDAPEEAGIDRHRLVPVDRDHIRYPDVFEELGKLVHHTGRDPDRIVEDPDTGMTCAVYVDGGTERLFVLDPGDELP